MKENLRSTSPANLVVLDMEGCRGAGSQLVSTFERASELKPPRSEFRGDSILALLSCRCDVGRDDCVKGRRSVVVVCEEANDVSAMAKLDFACAIVVNLTAVQKDSELRISEFLKCCCVNKSLQVGGCFEVDGQRRDVDWFLV
jgi:hypothetical protein